MPVHRWLGTLAMFWKQTCLYLHCFDYLSPEYGVGKRLSRGSMAPAYRCSERGASVRETAGRLISIETRKRPPRDERLGYATRIVCTVI